MKKVVLIGDSIRMGYQEVVREELAGMTEVVWAEVNGGDSRKVLTQLDEWAILLQPDVVHINTGLHDLKKNRQTGACQVPPDEYARNVEEILSTLLGGTKAKVIWAMTTPVNECWHQAKKPFDRYEADVTAYNQMAGEICGRLGVAIDDLYTAMMDADRDQYLEPDGVHFDQAGYRVLGRTVAGSIRASR